MSYVYPKSEFSNGVYKTHKIENNKIEKLKQSLQKITGQSPQIISQIEHIYRDLIKVESICEGDDKQKELYLKRQINSKYNSITKNLHIFYNVEYIEDYNFPILNLYHNTEKKEIHKYGDVLLIKNNSNWTICIKYESKESVEKLFDQVIKLI